MQGDKHAVVNIGGHRLTREMTVTVELHFMASSKSRPPSSVMAVLDVCPKDRRHAFVMQKLLRNSNAAYKVDVCQCAADLHSLGNKLG